MANDQVEFAVGIGHCAPLTLPADACGRGLRVCRQRRNNSNVAPVSNDDMTAQNQAVWRFTFQI
jgi:hypothetical protein